MLRFEDTSPVKYDQPVNDINFYDLCKKMKESPIKCKKYNYSLEECVQDFNHFESIIKLDESEKELIIQNYKLDFFTGEEKLVKSGGGSCKINEIEGFVFGPS